MTCRTDPVLPIIDVVTGSILQLFGPDDQCPAKVGTTETVRVIAGDDGAALAAWNSHTGGRGGCKEPLIWLREMTRYRSATFPDPAIDTNPCGLMNVVQIEVGVAWCAYVPEGDKISWQKLREESEKSMDACWRMTEVMCCASRDLGKTSPEGYKVGTGTLLPYGPDGGVMSWSSILYVGY